MQKSVSLIKNYEEIIQRLRVERAKIDSILKEEKKNYEKLSFDLLSAQAICSSFKESVVRFESLIREGDVDRNNLKEQIRRREEVEKILTNQLKTTNSEKAALQKDFKEGIGNCPMSSLTLLKFIKKKSTC